jgi:hypothetical protein
MSSTPVGPDIVTPDLATVLAALQDAPQLDDWEAVGKLVIPVMPRVRPLPPGSPAPLRILLPPGIAVGFGIDVGPAFMTITASELDALGITQADLVARALANLLDRAERVDPAWIVHEPSGSGIAGLQTGLSIASVLVLVPEHLARLFGTEPRLLVAPMRDAIFAVREDDQALAALLYEELATQDPNCLAPIAYQFDGRNVAVAPLDAQPPLARRLFA